MLRHDSQDAGFDERTTPQEMTKLQRCMHKLQVQTVPKTWKGNKSLERIVIVVSDEKAVGGRFMTTSSPNHADAGMM